jgi:predicted AAA+ superfamily ATPase
MGAQLMQSILETCQPLSDIITGSFNPEIFTASLSQVMDCYRGRATPTHALYTDAEQFFRDATYPTEGLRMALTEVFGRLAGDNTVPAIHRLETAFGGGKTHTLIALTHLGFRGVKLAAVTSGIIDTNLLQAPDEVAVVGVAGDEIPVHKPQGADLVPYTLWGEIAYQVGGEALYRQVESDATSYAAPGRNYFEQVLGNRKVLIMLDELAQYAARLEAARPDGGGQLAAFLMALHGYARTHPGIAVVLTLASQSDAFARQTYRLTQLITAVRGQDVSTEEAVGMAQRAETDIRSVVARDAVTVIPVQAAEISRVLAKRLFISIDQHAAQETADAYMDMYRRSASALPDRANREDFRESMVATYPFHPTFIDFLNQKLATVETFQGTRGVLRVLALAVRSLWRTGQKIPMIHTCHLDLRNARTINEIIGRTGSGDLLPVLNTDVGGPDTEALETGRSRAELADRKNPHPAGFSLHEYTWKTVFLHSLVGRAEGLGSNLFGITEQNALFEVSFPGMTPP